MISRLSCRRCSRSRPTNYLCAAIHSAQLPYRRFTSAAPGQFWPARANASSRCLEHIHRCSMQTSASQIAAPAQLVNQCLTSKSPYVRSHSQNPTAWQLWTPDTLLLARTQNKLLFVSIGYSACHWCHVMADESFNNPHVAGILNENFIPIKIDREERPDIDRVYMDFLQATTGGGGWPLNVFVTPDLQPIYGGTYWPGPQSPRADGAGFVDVLERVASAWQQQEAKCRVNADQITAQLRRFAEEGLLGGNATKPADSSADDPPEIELLEDAFEHYKHRFDTKHGGFGSAPKFPTPAHLSCLIRLGTWPTTVLDIVGSDETQEARDMVLQTLASMGEGGIKDQIGHGFSRYSVTRDWSLPHFEKMLYDNAQLLSVYLDAWHVEGDDFLEDIVHDIATYITTAPIINATGGFNASEDADSAISATDPEHKEGAYYVFSHDEFVRAVGAGNNAPLLADYYGVQEDGNVSPRHDVQGELAGKNTLSIQASIKDLVARHTISEDDATKAIEAGRQSLRQYREHHRPRPGLDDKIVVSWNGLAISGLARTASAFAVSKPEASATYLSAAVNAANFIKTSLYDPSTHTLKRVYREGPGEVDGFADDYAFLISGLLDLYAATFDESHLEWAYNLQQTQLRLFYDFDGVGGFFSTAKDSPDVLIRSKDAMDNAEPSANGVSAINLFRLAALLSTSASSSTAAATAPTPTDHAAAVSPPSADSTSAPPPLPSSSSSEANVSEHTDLRTLALRTLHAFDAELNQHPGLMTTLLQAVVHARLGTKAVMLCGPEGGAKIDAALKVLRGGIWPGVVVLRVPPGGVGEWLRGKDPLLGGVDGQRELVQVCSGVECRVVKDPGAELASVLKA